MQLVKPTTGVDSQQINGANTDIEVNISTFVEHHIQFIFVKQYHGKLAEGSADVDSLKLSGQLERIDFFENQLREKGMEIEQLEVDDTGGENVRNKAFAALTHKTICVSGSGDVMSATGPKPEPELRNDDTRESSKADAADDPTLDPEIQPEPKPADDVIASNPESPEGAPSDDVTECAALTTENISVDEVTEASSAPSKADCIGE